MTTWGDMTLSEAREWQRRHAEEGERCLCCTQMVKIYKRKLHATMAVTAIKLYRAGGEHEYIHGPSLPGDTHEISQLSWWRLADEELTRREDGGRAGYWRLTPVGVDFILGRCTIRKYARVYDGRCLGLHGEPVTIYDALGDRFDYGELMGL